MGVQRECKERAGSETTHPGNTSTSFILKERVTRATAGVESGGGSGFLLSLFLDGRQCIFMPVGVNKERADNTEVVERGRVAGMLSLRRPERIGTSGQLEDEF